MAGLTVAMQQACLQPLSSAHSCERCKARPVSAHGNYSDDSHGKAFFALQKACIVSALRIFGQRHGAERLCIT